VPRDQPVILDRGQGSAAPKTGKAASPTGARRAPPLQRGGGGGAGRPRGRS